MYVPDSVIRLDAFVADSFPSWIEEGYYRISLGATVTLLRSLGQHERQTSAAIEREYEQEFYGHVFQPDSGRWDDESN